MQGGGFFLRAPTKRRCVPTARNGGSGCSLFNETGKEEEREVVCRWGSKLVKVTLWLPPAFAPQRKKIGSDKRHDRAKSLITQRGKKPTGERHGIGLAYSLSPLVIQVSGVNELPQKRKMW